MFKATFCLFFFSVRFVMYSYTFCCELMCTSSSPRMAVILFAVPVATDRSHPHILAWQQNLWGRSQRRGMTTCSPCDRMVWNAWGTPVLCWDVSFVFWFRLRTPRQQEWLVWVAEWLSSLLCCIEFPPKLAMALVCMFYWRPMCIISVIKPPPHPFTHPLPRRTLSPCRSSTRKSWGFWIEIF